MGSVIAKFAFVPPPRQEARSFAASRSDIHHFATNKVCKQPTCILHLRAASPTALTILFCHGNAEDICHSFSAFRQLASILQVGVIAFDYQGYGASGDGKMCESNAFGDAEAALEYALVNVGIPRKQLVILGRSLGSGMAMHLAANFGTGAQAAGALEESATDDDVIGGLVLVSPLVTAASVASSCMGTMLYPFDIFCNRRKISQLSDKFPVQFFHGTVDEVVPFAHGKELYLSLVASRREKRRKRCGQTAAQEPVFSGASSSSCRASSTTLDNAEVGDPRATAALGIRCCWLEGCGHNDIEALRGNQFFAALREFMDDVRRSRVRGQ